MTRYPYDKPDKSHWKTFWSVFEAKQQRKRDQLNQLPIDQAKENTSCGDQQ